MRYLMLLLLFPGLLFAAPCADSTKAVLTWDKTDASVDYIEIHRADGACSAGSAFFYQRSLGADSTTMDDPNVVAGQSYCWVAYSFNSAGQKSGPSNTAECAIPFPPPPAPSAVQNLQVR